MHNRRGQSPRDEAWLLVAVTCSNLFEPVNRQGVERFHLMQLGVANW
jgi:hypothetical protein